MNTSVNQEWETTSEDLENDESASLPIECILPTSNTGMSIALCLSLKTEL